MASPGAARCAIALALLALAGRANAAGAATPAFREGAEALPFQVCIAAKD
jgi:hypothetical protein